MLRRKTHLSPPLVSWRAPCAGDKGTAGKRVVGGSDGAALLEFTHLGEAVVAPEVSLPHAPLGVLLGQVGLLAFPVSREAVRSGTLARSLVL